MERISIVGRLDAGTASQAAYFGLRKRVFLKSPVREDRTPGFVEGTPGHWRPYPDGVLVRISESVKFGISRRIL